MVDKIKLIAQFLKAYNIDCYFVGGCVRDELMNLAVSDIDICVVGSGSAERVHHLLEHIRQYQKLIDKITSVHGDFPIWIVEIDGVKYEYAMARKERKNGQSHQDFLVEVNNVTIEEDLYRRDLTINAIAKNVLTGQIVDPYLGMVDMVERVARPVSRAFMEDTLRVYRAARFIARFDLKPSDELIMMSKSLGGHGISNERVGMELAKVFKTAEKPSLFFRFLKEVGWLGYSFSEVEALIGVPQSTQHHPEGDVFEHTMYCIDAATDPFFRAVMLCHDLGKATKTTIDGIPYDFSSIQANPDSKIGAAGHEEAGVQLTKDMLRRISYASHKEIDKIACLVKLHMIRAVIDDGNHEKMLRRTIRELTVHDLKYGQLVLVILYDLSGRPPKRAPELFELTTELYMSRALELEDSNEMTPIVTGEKLIAAGIKPGKAMGDIIDHALELQDRGTLREDNWERVLRGAHPEFRNI